MKIFLLFLFFGIPCLVLGQGTLPLISHNSNVPVGIMYTPPNGYAFLPSNQRHVGRTSANQSYGRSYMEFSLSSLANITTRNSLTAEVVFDCGVPNPNNTDKHSVIMSILIPDKGKDPGLSKDVDIAYADLNAARNIYILIL